MVGAEKMGTLLNRFKQKNVIELKGSKKQKVANTILTLVIATIMIIPFIFMVSASFKYPVDVYTTSLQLIPKNVNLNNYFDVFKEVRFWGWYKNTVYVVLSVIIYRLFLLTLTAYAFSKMNFRGKNILFLCILAGMMIPGDLTIIARYIEYKFMGLTNTLWSLIIPGIFDAWLLFLLRQFFISIPMELSESALIDGCNHFGIYYKVILPLSKPAITTMMVFSFIWGWNSYLEPQIFITKIENQVLSVGINFFAQSIYGGGINAALLMAGACLSLIPVVIIFTLMQNYFLEGIAFTGIKG
jgi:multiple sugar transport system permease protein